GGACQAANRPPQLTQYRASCAFTGAPQAAHLSRKNRPQFEQKIASDSGRGPHVAHIAWRSRYARTAASSSASLMPPGVVAVAASWRMASMAWRVYRALSWA